MASIDYTALLTSQHRKRTKFARLVAACTEPLAENVDTMLALAQSFDLDTAVGKQLDILGLWIGVSRRVTVPLPIFFSFDTAGLGFDQGVWLGPFDVSTGVQLLDDDTYRNLLFAFVRANSWDGSLHEYQLILQRGIAGNGNTLRVDDNQDMTVDIVVSGPPMTAIVEALLTTGALTRIRPAGVEIASYSLP